VFLIHRHLIQLLQAIDQALSALGSGQAATPFATASMLEIRAVERAIGQLREVMQENEATREQLERLAITDSLTKQQGRNRVVTAPVGDATGETGRQPLNGDAPPSVDTAPS
jgi:DNA-binding protein H-NS